MGEAEAEGRGQDGGNWQRGQGWGGAVPLDRRSGGVREDFLKEQTPEPAPERECCYDSDSNFFFFFLDSNF